MVHLGYLFNTIIAALEETSEGVVISNPRLEDNPLVYVNHGFSDMTGYSADEAVGTNCRFLQCEETDAAELDELRRAIRAGKRCTVEIMNQRKDGTRFLNRLAIVPVYDASLSVEYFVGIQSDVTELRKAQREATALRALETTMTTVNDIALNAFNAMRYFSHQISENGTLSDEDRLAFDDIVADASTRLRAIAKVDHFETEHLGSNEVIKYDRADGEDDLAARLSP